MKKQVLLFAFTLAVLCSCSSDDDPIKKFSPDRYPQKWVLVQMTGSTQDPPLTGDDMPWQEQYVFNGDKTFVKSRDRDGVQTEVTGSYDSTTFSDTEGLALMFDSDEGLIGSCTSQNLQETLFFSTDGELFNTWNWCDGPGLKYERVE